MTWEGAILKTLRKERNMTQKQFAEWLEIPLITFTQWEQGTRTPPKYVIKLIQFKCNNSTKGEQLEISDEVPIYPKKIWSWDEAEKLINELENKKENQG